MNANQYSALGALAISCAILILICAGCMFALGVRWTPRDLVKDLVVSFLNFRLYRVCRRASDKELSLIEKNSNFIDVKLIAGREIERRKEIGQRVKLINELGQLCASAQARQEKSSNKQSSKRGPGR